MKSSISTAYQLSVWEDILTYVVENKKDPTVIKEIITLDQTESFWNTYALKTTYYKEHKLAVIGNHTSDSSMHAYDIQFITNVNGSFSLTFKMNFKYADENGELIENPLVKLLVNERKIKLKYQSKWYDFLIKQIDEDSLSQVFSYTANAAFINELSKKGSSLEFDDELENNLGTVTELGGKVLKDTGWSCSKNNSDTLHDYINEQLYSFTLNTAVTASIIDFNSSTGLGAQRTFPSGTKVYCFSSTLNQNKEEIEEFQFLYVDGALQIDDDFRITNGSNYICASVKFKTKEGTTQIPFSSFPSFLKYSTEEVTYYNADRINRKQSTYYHENLQRYATIWTQEGNSKDIYLIQENEFITSETVNNLIINYKNFTNREFWDYAKNGKTNLKSISSGDSKYATLQCVLENKNSYIMNSSLSSSSSLETLEKGFEKNEKFCLTLRGAYRGINSKGEAAYLDFNTGGYSFLTDEVKIQLRTQKKLDNGTYGNAKVIFQTTSSTNWKRFKSSENDDATRYNRVGCAVTIDSGITLEELQELTKTNTELDLLIISKTDGEKIFLLEEIMLFPWIPSLENTTLPIQPDDIIQSYYNLKDYYFYLNAVAIKAQGTEPSQKNSQVSELKNLALISPTPTGLKRKYDPQCVKKRRITASESNCFDLIQNLCEAFECWADFVVKHDDDGTIILRDDYTQTKSVKFKEYVGRDNPIGFKAGINLSSISRTVNSDAIITKLIVKTNQNEHAIDGLCSIARASENYIKENFIYDFSYFENQGLLDKTAVWSDLYNTADGRQGLYVQLANLNKDNYTLSKEQSDYLLEYTQLDASYIESSKQLEQTKKERLNEIENLASQLGVTSSTVEKNLSNDDYKHWKTEQYDEKRKQINSLAADIIILEKEIKDINTEMAEALAKSNQRKEKLETIAEQTKALVKDFETKYSSYIQEGSWVSEDYIDDNEYYLDAISTAHTSAQPQITYSIKVVDIGSISGLKDFQFRVGDKTFVQDPQFFGWIIINGKKYPRKEEVIVSEISSYLDHPQDNTITVQNFKTQFEDLFQRIAATTAQIEFSTGKFEKASTIINSDGSIKADALSAALANNTFTIKNAKNETVVTDDKGITVANKVQLGQQLRITSGGIFISRDGGRNWTTGINANGINTSLLTAGSIDTKKITVGNGEFPSFRWDMYGISAYSFTDVNNSEAEESSFNFNNYTRYDQYGFYGIKGIDDFVPTSEQDVIDKASFSLTWSGFHLKTTGAGVSGIEITSENDFRVLSKQNKEDSIERVKIGRLSDVNNTTNVGIRIKSNSGSTILETEENGGLWLKDRLDIQSSNYDIAIGNLGKKSEEVIESKKDYNRIFEAGGTQTLKSNFVIWEDGSVYANDGYFRGTLHADKTSTFAGDLEAATGTFSGSLEAATGTFKGTILAGGGQIGNVTIEQIEEVTNKGIVEAFIESSAGQFIDADAEDQSISLIAHIMKEGQEIEVEVYEWYEYNGNESEKIGEGKILNIDMNDYEKRRIYFIAS